MEIRRMLAEPQPRAALELLRETNLLPHVLPEVAGLPPAPSPKPAAILTALHDPIAPARTCRAYSQVQETAKR